MTAVDMEVTRSAVLDEAHVGDIRGALGTIRLDDTAARTTVSAKFKTLLAIVGPGLIVMIGDNDAGAFSTYGQAGQDYGTRLLWTLLLLIPVLYVNQEMVLRLGESALNPVSANPGAGMAAGCPTFARTRIRLRAIRCSSTVRHWCSAGRVR